MLFPTYIFVFLFAPVAIGGFWLIKHRTARLAWLALMSYIFYGYWEWAFTSLLIVSTIINYFSGLKLARISNDRARKAWFCLAMIVNLGMLGFFKYYMLFARTIDSIFGWTNAGQGLPNWNIILPIGISFFTFQAMSYTIDVYRRDIKPTKDFIEFAAYIALFPQLIAGPIVRYREIMETLKNLPRKFSSVNLNLGLFYFSTGLIRKVLIADQIAAIIDPMFALSGTLQPLEAWLMMIGYSFQLYMDFSGYSLMAIGLGHMLGFKFPQNFNNPYTAVSISDFWRRWHMTLSRWLRDYLYIPLGGRDNRYVALGVTMLLGGLWHGAEWTFMVWGLYHGILLQLHHHLKRYSWIPRNVIWAKAGTFIVATVGWVFFRPPTFAESFGILGKMFDIPGLFAQVSINYTLVFLILVGFAWEYLIPNEVVYIREKKAKPLVAWAIVLGLLMALCVLHFSQPAPFIYYQF